MAKSSLETMVATYLIQLFQTHPVLRKKQMRHDDSTRVAEPDVVTISARQGEDLLEGPRGPNGEYRSKVDVTVRYRSPNGNDLVADAVNDCIRTAGSRSTAIQNTPGFWLMIMDENIAADRGHNKNSRWRELRVPCEAGQIS